MGNLWGSFWGLSLPLKAVLAAVILLALMVASLFLVLLSPLMVILALLAFAVFAGVFLFKLLSRRHLATKWAVAAGSSLVLIFVFAGVSSALYGSGTTAEVAEREPTTDQTTPEETAAAEETIRTDFIDEEVEQARIERERERELGEERQREAEQAAARKAAEQEAVEQESQREAAEQEAVEQEAAERDAAERDAEREAAEREAAEREAAEREAVEAAGGDHVATVTSVVDGDTFDISPAVDGIDRVRIIGVDTPETSFGVEPLGYEATAFAESLISGREVTLEFDVERIDPFDRALAYVYLPDGRMFNEALAAEGYAQVATYPPNVKYVDRFLAAQESARAAGLGLWGLTASEQCEFDDRGNGIGGGCEAEDPPDAPDPSEYEAESPEVVGGAAGTSGAGSAPTGDSCPADEPIKGNDSSGGELIYHSPGGAFYDRTNPEECFATGAAAEAAGYRASQR